MRINAGFTLVELITTILLIAILSVVALPRLMTNSSYSAFTLRDEFISELRKVQLMAMNNQDRCYQIDVDNDGYQLVRFDDSTCTGNSVTEPKQAFTGGASLQLISTNTSTFGVSFNTSGISSLACNGECVNVIADETLIINIENQGYIYGR